MDGIEKIKVNILSKIVSTKSYALKGDTFDVIAHIIQECRLDW